MKRRAGCRPHKSKAQVSSPQHTLEMLGPRKGLKASNYCQQTDPGAAGTEACDLPDRGSLPAALLGEDKQREDWQTVRAVQGQALPS